MALLSTRPQNNLEETINVVGINLVFHVVVTAEDVYRGKPDPEMFADVTRLLQFILEVKTKCVVVASKHPDYELTAADLGVRSFDELSVVDLKILVDIDSEFGVEVELVAIDDHDDFW
ncbi:putative HAD superfamily, haloacid dehalogenase-like hydrolase [Helianthus annuus]|nr:putative HAD superfamily, haloacid dehalogenase-like hydrolase [Helianthus annuus]